MKRNVLLAALFVCTLAVGAPDGPDSPDGIAAEPVVPNLLLNLALTYVDASAAYPGSDDYQRERDYAGYFNGHMCYRYPVASGTGEPDRSEGSGYFSILRPADALHECAGDSFSGNFLNWASASVLDILRYALTGGDRVIDQPGLTVLARAVLPDGSWNVDFYAHSQFFPRKRVRNARKVTPFSTPLLYVVSCRDRILFGNAARGGSCDAASFALRHTSGPASPASDQFFGQYLARVRVCDPRDTADRPDLCQPYGGGHKPEGALQRNAGTMRIGVMSYPDAIDPLDPNVYGGVLRAPLKLLGGATRDAPDAGPGVESSAEWDARDGVLAANPDRTRGTLSGAINLINRLGRYPVPYYPLANPLAELDYEALRYLQGRGPGAALRTAVPDALPARHDPIQVACQRTVVATIARGDGRFDHDVPGNTRSTMLDPARAPERFGGATLDVMQATRRVGELEGGRSGALGNGAARADLARLDILDPGPGVTGSYYLAGLAYWAHNNAIRPDMPLRLDHYMLNLEAGGRAGPLWLAAKYGGFNDRNGDANPFRTSAADGSVQDNDSEWSADGVVPEHYFSPSDPHHLIAAVRALFARAATPPGRANGPTLVTDASNGEATIIRADFDQANWGGSVKRYAITQGANGVLRVSTTPLWDAGLVLTGDSSRTAAALARPAPSARKIYTLLATPERRMVPFTWANLTPEVRAHFMQRDLSDGTPVDALGEGRVNYLRGERRGELGQPGGQFRRRVSILGDSINGTPLQVGAPSAALQGAGYAAFRARYQHRRKAIFLGANDGMLHAFDMNDGVELFAYLPSALLPSLSALTSSDYVHRAYVDGPAVAAEADVAGTWRTVLVSGMGGGAPGVFALDVTDPSNFEGGRGVLWEFGARDDPAMGAVSSAPLIAKLNTGPGEFRYVALVVSTAPPGPDAARAVLFALALDKPLAAPWRLGVNYYKLGAPVQGAGIPNALAAPAVASHPDGSVHTAWAGDMQGNLWRFDLRGAAPWSGALGATRQPLFVARDGLGHRQAITQQPKVVYAPGGGYLLLFGTDTRGVQTQNGLASFYAVRDTSSAPTRARTRADLALRTLNAQPDSTLGFAVHGVELVYDGPDAKFGWYVDFPNGLQTGERSVAGAVLRDGALMFDTIVRGTDVCAGASARSYVLDALSGLAFNTAGVLSNDAVTGQLLGPAQRGALMLVPVGTVVGQRRPDGRARAVRRYARLHVGRDGTVAPAMTVELAIQGRRLSWREVANWHELHDLSRR